MIKGGRSIIISLSFNLIMIEGRHSHSCLLPDTELQCVPTISWVGIMFHRSQILRPLAHQRHRRALRYTGAFLYTQTHIPGEVEGGAPERWCWIVREAAVGGLTQEQDLICKRRHHTRGSQTHKTKRQQQAPTISHCWRMHTNISIVSLGSDACQ